MSRPHCCLQAKHKPGLFSQEIFIKTYFIKKALIIILWLHLKALVHSDNVYIWGIYRVVFRGNCTLWSWSSAAVCGLQIMFSWMAENCEDRTRAGRTSQPVKRVCVSELIMCVCRCSSTAWASDRTASLLPSFLLHGFISAILSAHLAGLSTLFPKLTVPLLASECLCQYTCLPVLLSAFVVVCLLTVKQNKAWISVLHLFCWDILIFTRLTYSMTSVTPGWVVLAGCQPLDPTLPVMQLSSISLLDPPLLMNAYIFETLQTLSLLHRPGFPTEQLV